MDTIDTEQKNETDTGATVPASTDTATYQEQPVDEPLAVAEWPCNQKPHDPLPEKNSSTQQLMRMTAWGFPILTGSQNGNSASASSSKSGRMTREEMLEHFEAMSRSDSLENQDLHTAPGVSIPEVRESDAAPPRPETIAPDEKRLHTSQPTAQQNTDFNQPPVVKATSAKTLSPICFPSFPSCPAPGQGCNVWCLNAAYACERYGLSPEAAASLIRAQISRAPRGDEIERAVKKAYSTDSLETVQPPITACYDEAELRALAYKAPNWDFEALKTVSPVDVRSCTTIQYLRHIFKNRECVLIAASNDDPGTIWLNDPADPNSTEDELDSFQKPAGGKGAWFLSNPVTGDFVKLERRKTSGNPQGRTLRSRENLTSFRYLVLESDEAPQDLWISAVVQLPLPIVSIVTSGGKSLHALVRIDAANGEQWSAIKQRIGPALVTLGADKNSLTDVRLTRLPGSYRAEKGRWQELVYLNPNADETPICKLPARATT